MRRALAVPLCLCVLLAAGSAASSAARAQMTAPTCGPHTRGMLACMAGQVCACDWYPGGLITDQHPGWRWACRIEQMCGAPSPADEDAPTASPFPTLPPGVDGVEMP